MKSRIAAAVVTLVLFVVGFVMLSPPTIVRAVGPTGLSLFQTAAAGSDPCQNPSVLKQSASIAVTTATTTALVTPIAGDYISVCKWQIYASGTAPSIVFEYGTVASTACDTGATVLTGTMPITTGTTVVNSSSDGLSLRVGVVSQELCLVTAGTSTPTWEGYVTYVQQPY
jgi:hypothetical protein